MSRGVLVGRSHAIVPGRAFSATTAAAVVAVETLSPTAAAAAVVASELTTLKEPDGRDEEPAVDALDSCADPPPVRRGHRPAVITSATSSAPTTATRPHRAGRSLTARPPRVRPARPHGATSTLVPLGTNSTHVCPGVRAIGWPAASVNLVTCERSSRLQVPRCTFPWEKTHASPVPTVM